MDRAEIERIARGLTKAQRFSLKLIAAAPPFVPVCVPCHSKSAQALFRRELIHRAPLSGNRFAVKVTDLGRAVADYLRESADG